MFLKPPRNSKAQLHCLELQSEVQLLDSTQLVFTKHLVKVSWLITFFISLWKFKKGKCSHHSFIFLCQESDIFINTVYPYAAHVYWSSQHSVQKKRSQRMGERLSNAAFCAGHGKPTHELMNSVGSCANSEQQEAAKVPSWVELLFRFLPEDLLAVDSCRGGRIVLS